MERFAKIATRRTFKPKLEKCKKLSYFLKKVFLIFQEKELSYISGKRHPKKTSYISGSNFPNSKNEKKGNA